MSFWSCAHESADVISSLAEAHAASTTLAPWSVGSECHGLIFSARDFICSHESLLAEVWTREDDDLLDQLRNESPEFRDALNNFAHAFVRLFRACRTLQQHARVFALMRKYVRVLAQAFHR